MTELAMPPLALTFPIPYDRYGFAAVDLRNGRTYREGDSGEFETASSLKSILATLAITQAMSDGIDPSTYKMRVDRRHDAPGAFTLLGNYRESVDRYVTEDNRPFDGSMILSLDSLLHTMITHSDGVATNAAIEYLGGKEIINQRIQRELGLHTTRLVCDRLAFTRPETPIEGYQVGMTTPDELASYYSELDETLANNGLDQSQRDHYWDYYTPEATSLFDTPHSQLPDEMDWRHKTGSIYDHGEAWSQGALVDAGVMNYRGRSFAVAAATMQLHDTSVPEATIRQDFAQRNTIQLDQLLSR